MPTAMILLTIIIIGEPISMYLHLVIVQVFLPRQGATRGSVSCLPRPFTSWAADLPTELHQQGGTLKETKACREDVVGNGAHVTKHSDLINSLLTSNLNSVSLPLK